MTTTILTNAFSINMLQSDIKLDFQKIDIKTVLNNIKQSDNFISAIGHADTANIVKNQLGISDNLFNRISVSIDNKDTRLIIAQYKGNRLPEGATVLPEGAMLEYWLVRVI